MHHTREEVIERTIREYELLDKLVSSLAEADWDKPVPRPESKDAWTIKDSLAHITHWKADAVRRVRKEPVPAEERGLNINEGNRLIYLRWRDRAPQEVLAWHRQVQKEALEALRAAPDAYFIGKVYNPQWPYDLVGHCGYHRLRDIEKALAGKRGK